MKSAEQPANDEEAEIQASELTLGMLLDVWHEPVHEYEEHELEPHDEEGGR